MFKIYLKWMVLIVIFAANYCVFGAESIPANFVYLNQIDPSILQDMRYADAYNFIGRPIKGYLNPTCILTRPAAIALAQVQKSLKKYQLGLIVYDCYRPQIAVNDFMEWAAAAQLQQMKNEYYPRVNKKDFFRLGYVAARSGHTRGSTVDLSIIPLTQRKILRPNVKQKQAACFAPYHQRFFDGSIDMGTNFDCMDPLSHVANKKINFAAYQHRQWLQRLMIKYGFVPYDNEWWHFTLKNEPYPHTYFNFPVN